MYLPEDLCEDAHQELAWDSLTMQLYPETEALKFLDATSAAIDTSAR